MKQVIGSSKAHVRLSGWLEGVSFLLLLLIAMPLKYLAGQPEAVRIVGSAHGALFVWYVASVLYVRQEHGLAYRQTALALVASLLPGGTFYADKKIFKHL